MWIEKISDRLGDKVSWAALNKSLDDFQGEIDRRVETHAARADDEIADVNKRLHIADAKLDAAHDSVIKRLKTCEDVLEKVPSQLEVRLALTG